MIKPVRITPVEMVQMIARVSGVEDIEFDPDVYHHYQTIPPGVVEASIIALLRSTWSRARQAQVDLTMCCLMTKGYALNPHTVSPTMELVPAAFSTAWNALTRLGEIKHVCAPQYRAMLMNRTLAGYQEHMGLVRVLRDWVSDRIR